MCLSTGELRLTNSRCPRAAKSAHPCMQCVSARRRRCRFPRATSCRRVHSWSANANQPDSARCSTVHTACEVARRSIPASRRPAAALRRHAAAPCRQRSKAWPVSSSPSRREEDSVRVCSSVSSVVSVWFRQERAARASECAADCAVPATRKHAVILVRYQGLSQLDRHNVW